MSAYSRNYFEGGYVEKGDTVYVLSQKIVGYKNGMGIPSGYEINPYTVTAVGRKYISAKMSDKPARRIKKFEPLASIRPGYGYWLEEAGTPLGDKAWRDCLFPSRESAETYRGILEKREAERNDNSGGGEANDKV